MNSLTYENLKITWLGHASFLISGPANIYIDPWELESGLPKADLILISHEHRDHMSLPDIEKLSKADTKIVGNTQVCEQLENCIPLKPFEEININNIKITGFPAYNENKFRSPGIPFHPKQDEKLGFIIEIEGTKIFHAGDTDFLNQMVALDVDIALVPIGGTYTMGANEAAAAVNAFKPKIAIPMHWGKIVGTKTDAEEFKRLAEVEVEILESR